MDKARMIAVAIARGDVCEILDAYPTLWPETMGQRGALGLCLHWQQTERHGMRPRTRSVLTDSFGRVVLVKPWT